ncbi:natriuretic peptide A-like [Pempheris klunzingeri]|uniref:natriuretic peptide A-like n=1 Tax=Pempheris klunzingeri TaxID=3127111 RepID=UPI0039818F35
MKPNFSLWCFSLLLLLNVAGAKPVSDLQSLKQLLDQELNTAPYSLEEEMDAGGPRGDAAKSAFTWDSSDPSNWAVGAKDDVIGRLFKDLMRTSKRSWSRYKKGGLRSCFGVRLERIGSFSGLGC